jgi:hypothetical protein
LEEDDKGERRYSRLTPEGREHSISFLEKMCEMGMVMRDPRPSLADFNRDNFSLPCDAASRHGEFVTLAIDCLDAMLVCLCAGLTEIVPTRAAETDRKAVTATCWLAEVRNAELEMRVGAKLEIAGTPVALFMHSRAMTAVLATIPMLLLTKGIEAGIIYVPEGGAFEIRFAYPGRMVAAQAKEITGASSESRPAAEFWSEITADVEERCRRVLKLALMPESDMNTA